MYFNATSQYVSTMPLTFDKAPNVYLDGPYSPTCYGDVTVRSSR